MCVAFWTLEQPDYALILCSNRDEFLGRPTRDAALHDFGHGGQARILSGRDALAGGTWLGMNVASGRVALLTNITEPPQSYPASRGALVAAVLQSHSSPPASPPRPPPRSRPSSPRSSPPPRPSRASTSSRSPCARPTPALHYAAARLSNGGGGAPIHARPLRADERAGGALSNGVDPEGDAWPKVVAGRAAFAAAVAQHASAPRRRRHGARRALFGVLMTTAPAPVTQRADLRHTVHVAPLALAGGALYATRLATVLLVRRDGGALFVERDVW
ncbi:NRDE protein-domain-containing protein, partial [Mycena sp. CBHHK59/15]